MVEMTLLLFEIADGEHYSIGDDALEPAGNGVVRIIGFADDCGPLHQLHVLDRAGRGA